MPSGPARYTDPRWSNSTSRDRGRPLPRPPGYRAGALTSQPRASLSPRSFHSLNQHFGNPSQRGPPPGAWPPPVPSYHWPVPPPPYAYWHNGHPIPPPYHTGPDRRFRSKPRPSFPLPLKADSKDLNIQRNLPWSHGTPNTFMKTSTSSCDGDGIKTYPESNGRKEKECDKVVGDKLSCDRKSNETLGNNSSTCSAVGGSKSSPNRVKQEVQCPKSPKKPLLKVKSEKFLLDPLLTNTDDQHTLKTKPTSHPSNKRAEDKRCDTSVHSSQESSMDAVSRDHVLYRFLVSELAMKCLSRCMDGGPTHTTVEEAQAVQDVLMILLFLKSHGNVTLLCALGVVEVLSAQNVKGNFVVTHQASFRSVSLSSSENNYFKNFIRNVRPTITKDSYGLLFKNGDSPFSDLSLRQALRYCWAKAKVGLDASVLWSCLGQLPDDGDTATVEDLDTLEFTAATSDENQAPLVDQAVVVNPSKSETENSSSPDVLKDLPVTEESGKSEAETVASAATILESKPLLKESPSRKHETLATTIPEQQPVVAESAQRGAKISQAAVSPKEELVVRKSPKRLTEVASPAVSAQVTKQERTVSRKKCKSKGKKKVNLHKLSAPNPIHRHQFPKNMRTDWPLSVLHQLCPGLKYSVVETRAPGCFYPLFAVSTDIRGRHFTMAAPAIKRAKFLLAQCALKVLFNIDNVHGGRPETSWERKERRAAERRDNQREKRNR